MKKCPIVILILVLIGVVIFFFKPYVRDYEVLFDGNMLKVRDNIISGSIEVFDTSKLVWVSVPEYRQSLLDSANLKYKALMIDNYDTFLQIINGELSQYEFISPDEINYLNRQNIMVNDIASIKKLMKSFNKLIEDYELMELNRIKLIGVDF